MRALGWFATRAQTYTKSLLHETRNACPARKVRCGMRAAGPGPGAGKTRHDLPASVGLTVSDSAVQRVATKAAGQIPGQAIQREGRQDRQGIVTHVAPLHGVSIDEMLHALQRQSKEAHGDDDADFLMEDAGEGKHGH